MGVEGEKHSSPDSKSLEPNQENTASSSNAAIQQGTMEECRAAEKEEVLFYVLCSKSAKGMLFVKDGGNWVLPFLREVEVSALDNLNFDDHLLMMRRKYNLNLEMRYLYSMKDSGDDSFSYDLLHAQDESVEELPEGACFRSKDEVLNMKYPGKGNKIWKYILKHMLEVLEGSEPDSREVYCRRGEAFATVKWMTEKILATGNKIIGRISQHLVQDESVIFRAKTAQGYYYLKAVPRKPWYSNEATITDCVSRLFPNIAIQPVAIHAERRWILTKDFGSHVKLAPEGPIRRAEITGILDVLIKIHRESQTNLDELAQSGLECCGPLWLKNHIQSVFQDPLLQECLEKEKVEVLLAHTSFWKKLCDTLARYEVPITLVHEDPSLVNIVAPYGVMMLHDWGLSSLSVPFYDVVILCRSVIREMAKEDPGATRKDLLSVLDTEYYLRKWEHWRPLPELKFLLRLSSYAYYLHSFVLNYKRLHHLERVCDQLPFRQFYRRLAEKLVAVSLESVDVDAMERSMC